MNTAALGTPPPSSGAGPTFHLAPLDGGRLLGAVSVGAVGARAVVVLLDDSGSLTGPPLARARAFVERLVAGLGARPVAVVAAGGAPSLLRALGPATAAEGLPARAPAGRADLPRAAALVRAEARRAAGGLGAVDLVVVSDLALCAPGVEALRALEREGARLHLVHAASSRPARGELEPAARLGAGDAVSAVLARLEEASDARLAVALTRLPRAWFSWRPGRLQGGAPASLARVEVPVGEVVAFVIDDDLAGSGGAQVTLGEAWLAHDGADERRAPLAPGRAGVVDPALVEAVRLAGGGGAW